MFMGEVWKHLVKPPWMLEILFLKAQIIAMGEAALRTLLEIKYTIPIVEENYTR
jgi:hypothetical protein